MTNGKGQTSAPVNVLLMLTDHLPNRHRELRDELKRVEQREQDIRAEISRLEKHAAIEGIHLTAANATEPLTPAEDSSV